MIINEETYLEHFGVKGMQWGVRKDRKLLTPKEKQRRAQRARKVTSAALTGIFIASIMSSPRSRVPVSNFTTSVKEVAEEASEHITSETHTIAKNAREILMAQEAQRNGAHQTRLLLQRLGADVVPLSEAWRPGK